MFLELQKRGDFSVSVKKKSSFLSIKPSSYGKIANRQGKWRNPWENFSVASQARPEKLSLGSLHFPYLLAIFPPLSALTERKEGIILTDDPICSSSSCRTERVFLLQVTTSILSSLKIIPRLAEALWPFLRRHRYRRNVTELMHKRGNFPTKDLICRQMYWKQVH